MAEVSRSLRHTDILVGVEPRRDIPGVFAIFATRRPRFPEHVRVIREELVGANSSEGSVFFVHIAV